MREADGLIKLLKLTFGGRGDEQDYMYKVSKLSRRRKSWQGKICQDEFAVNYTSLTPVLLIYSQQEGVIQSVQPSPCFSAGFFARAGVVRLRGHHGGHEPLD